MIEYLIILLLSFPPLLWFGDGSVLLGHDAGFRLDYMAQLPSVFYSWESNYNFGADWSLFKGFLVTQFPEIAFSWFTRSFHIGQLIALLFWFAVMGMAMLVFLRKVFPGKQYRFFRIFTSIFYMYNYYILDAWGIGERAKFSLYAALPLGLLLIYNVFVRKKSAIRNGILFGLLYFFLNGGGVLPLYGATIVVLGFAFLYFGYRRPLVIFAFLLPFLLINAYYIIPNVYLLRTSYASSVGGQGGIDGLIAWERVISSHASLTNILRLQGIPTLYNNPWHPFTSMLQTPLFVVASFIPIIVVILGFLYFRPKHPLLRFLMLLLPVGLVFTMGTHPPIGILYEQAMKHIPGFVIFRSSFYKFAPAFWLPMIVLTGYFLNELRPHRFIKLFLIIGLLAYHYPFFTTDQFVIGNGFSTRIKIPDYLKNITGDLKKYVKEKDAVLIMPKMKEFSPAMPADMYTWGYFGLDIFPRNAVNRRFIANDSGLSLVDSLYEAFYRGDSEVVTNLTEILGTDYVLWRGDAISSSESSSEAKALLIKQVYKTGPWELYRTGEEPKTVTLSAQFLGYQGSQKGAAYLVEYLGKTLVSPGDDIVEAECMLCDEGEYDKLVSSIVPITPKWYEKWTLKKNGSIDTDLSMALRGNSDRNLEDAFSKWKKLQGRSRVVYANRLKAFWEALKKPVPAELDNAAWISEEGMYRFIAPVVEGYDFFPVNVKVRISDNLQFIESSSRFIFLVRQQTPAINTPSSFTYKKVNPTKYVVFVTANDEYLLTLRERFDARWKISVAGKHVEVNSFANGWIIDKKGAYDIEVYFEPQRLFYIGLAVSGVALLLCLGVLVHAKKQ